MGDDDWLKPAESAEINRAMATLGDPALWIEPDPQLEDSVVAAITREASGTRRRRRMRYALLGLAATILAAVGTVAVVQLTQEEPTEYTASMTGTELAPSAAGKVVLTRTESGWEIKLQARGLPRRSGGEFYEAWLKDEAGSLVPIGTFNDAEDVILWSGVSPEEFPTLTVTREVADGDQASSGKVVLLGLTSRS